MKGLRHVHGDSRNLHLSEDTLLQSNPRREFTTTADYGAVLFTTTSVTASFCAPSPVNATKLLMIPWTISAAGRAPLDHLLPEPFHPVLLFPVSRFH